MTQREIIEGIGCGHPLVTRGQCSAECALSKTVDTPHYDDAVYNPFLVGSCRFCGAALIDVCDDCNERVP